MNDKKPETETVGVQTSSFVGVGGDPFNNLLKTGTTQNYVWGPGRLDKESNEALQANFPADQIKTIKDPYSQLTLSFVSGDKIIDRLNGVLGNRWNFHIMGKPEIIENMIIVHGSMTIDGVTKEQFGSKRITMYPPREVEVEGPVAENPEEPKKRGRKKKNVSKKVIPGGPVDLGYDYKSATTDCIKKLASLFGVALHLYAEDEKTTEIDQGSIVPKAESTPKMSTAVQINAIKRMMKKLKPEALDNFDDYIKTKYKVEAIQNLTFDQAASELKELNILNSGGSVPENPFDS